MELLQAGYQVTVVNRGNNNQILPNQVTRVLANRNNPEQFKKALSKLDVDAVFDFSCFTPEQLTPVLRALYQKKIKYIFCSTVYVYQHYSTLLEDESQRARYLTPLQVNSERKAKKWYGSNKIKCEDLLLDRSNHNFDVTILRLPHVIGSNNNEFERENFYLQKIFQQDSLQLPWGGKNLFHFVHVQDVVKVCVAILEGRTRKNVYIVASKNPIPVKQYIALLAEAANRLVTLTEADDLISSQLMAEGCYHFIYPFDISYESHEIWEEINEEDTPIGSSIISDLQHDIKKWYPEESMDLTSAGLQKMSRRNNHG